MPGNQVKDWKVYHECMKDKAHTPKNKGYCARVANAVAAGTIKHSDPTLASLTASLVTELVRIGAEQGLREAQGDQ